MGTVANRWSYGSTRDHAKSVVIEDSFVLKELRAEEDGWVSIDVTDAVVNFLRCELPNRGFALFPSDENALGVFMSGKESDISDAPRIVVTAELGERSTSYGKFGFSKQPEQGFTDPIVGGNCLSYAMRDNDGMLLFEDYQFDYDEMNRIFLESGENGILEYLALIVEEYVEAHKEGLQISSFRRIDDFDSPIDPEKEYRVVLRVSNKEASADVPMSDRGGFDYHLWAQLDDGRWTQKYPSSFSWITPGSGPGISPLKFVWDAGEWGFERYQEWYASDGVYYAVTKDTDEFTQHLHLQLP
jgi:hypothetical protein